MGLHCLRYACIAMQGARWGMLVLQLDHAGRRQLSTASLSEGHGAHHAAPPLPVDEQATNKLLGLHCLLSQPSHSPPTHRLVAPRQGPGWMGCRHCSLSRSRLALPAAALHSHPLFVAFS